jgi:hypothetical protein
MQGLVGLTNGIIRDERVFHIDDPNWISMYNEQGSSYYCPKFYTILKLTLYTTFPIVIFEAQSKRAWVDAKPDVVIIEALERLRLEGWTALRPALSTTIRAWIMRGFLEGGLRRAKSVEVEFLGYALEVLDWGSRVWKDVPKDDCGAIFQRTFIRGVRSLHIRALMEVCMHLFN